GDDSDVYCSYFNITEQGNFESSTNIPHITSASDASKAISNLNGEEFDRIIDKQEQILMAGRSKRTRPTTDDKILTSWNGLAISGLSKGYQITRDNKYRDAALRAATFIRDSLYENGQLIHSYRLGKRSEGLFLEDYAYLTRGLIDLYEVVYDYEWIEFASQLATDATRLFSNYNGDLFLSPAGQDDHFMRPKYVTDGALPAPGSILIQSLLKVADITGNKEFRKQAEKSIAAVSNTIVRAPSGMTSAATALGYLDADKIELILVGEKDRESFLDEVYGSYIPNRVTVVSDKGDEDIALLQGRQSNGKTVAYVCRNLTCKLPAETPEELRRQLAEITTGL
ncbi:MAG: thioredoxin domain-containing protein, partial [candidate division Zixibacteria bacterium]|nr:thioredoxin domain-containing protein [candidate division Zixibacteria bacterium]